MNNNITMDFSSIFGSICYVPTNCKNKKMEKDFVEFTTYLEEYIRK